MGRDAARFVEGGFGDARTAVDGDAAVDRVKPEKAIALVATFTADEEIAVFQKRQADPGTFAGAGGANEFDLEAGHGSLCAG